MSSPEIVEGGGEQPGDAKPKSKKKLFIIAGAGAVLLLGGGGAGFMMMSGGDAAAAAEAGDHGGEGDHGEAAKGEGEGGGDHGGGGEAAYVDVPPVVVNLRSPDGAPRFLKLHFMIVPGPKGSAEALKEMLPRILDAYQPFLRELRPDDLAGSAAVYRIKEEMLVRASDAAGPGMIDDILIQDLIQQ